MPPILSAPRLVGVAAGVFLVIFFFVAAYHHDSPRIQSLKNTAQSAAKHICPASDHHDPHYEDSRFGSTVHKLYASIRHPITAEIYVDPAGREHRVASRHFKEPLGKKVLIIDMDTRIPNGPNELWNSTTMNYEALDASKGSQMVSASLMNHFLYSQIHGYDYKFYAARHLKHRHDTWIKPHVLHELLHYYKFVVFIDADAVIQHLELPLEWLFNKWGVGPETTVAMPLDTRQILNGDRNASMDSKGNVELNTGFVVAHGTPLTFKTMAAWRDCPEGKRYEGCKHWAKHWSHEQRAFSEYIRYDFNPNNNIVEIPCDDAMGFPGIVEENKHILSNCTGQFVRHHTVGKARTKTDVTNTIVQSMAQLMQKSLQQDKDEYWLSAGQTESFLKKFQHHD